MLGIFKHHQFNKIHVADFLYQMCSLTSFSLFDEQRALIQFEEPGSYPGAKIMTYSALKLALIDSDLRQKNSDSFRCSLTELKVVDRKLNPEYLLQACPQLRKLVLGKKINPFRLIEIREFQVLFLFQTGSPQMRTLSYQPEPEIPPI